MKLEHCPVRTTLKVVGGKWKPVILYQLMDAQVRYGELRRLLSEASQKVLTQQLRELERDGIVQRRVLSEVPPHVEYSLTAYGQTLRPITEALCEWGRRHKHQSPSLTAVPAPSFSR